MRDPKQALHDMIDEAREEDLPFLAELVTRFQRPLDFPLGSQITALPHNAEAERRQRLVSQAHSATMWAHLRRRQLANTANRLGIDPFLIESAAGSSSGGEGGFVEMECSWFKESAFYRLHTFRFEGQEITSFDEAAIASTGSEVAYRLRVLTANAESEADLNVPL